MSSALSVLDFANMGSSLSVRNFARLGSSLSIDGAVHFGKKDTYLKYTDGAGLEVRVEGERSLVLEKEGGHLHGVWTQDTPLTTSDRRLKHAIMPLARSLAAEIPADQTKEADSVNTPSRKPPPGADKATTVSWVLRELRPVSYRFRKGPEAKYSRFGFVAQEVQQVLPSLVRGTGKDDKHLSVLYQDLIAVLTLAHQVLEDRVAEQQTKMQAAEDRVAEQQKMIQAQEDKLNQMMEYIKAIDAKLSARRPVPVPEPVQAVVPAPNAITLQDDRILELMELIKKLDAKVEARTTEPSSVSGIVARASGRDEQHVRGHHV